MLNDGKKNYSIFVGDKLNGMLIRGMFARVRKSGVACKSH